MFVLRVYYVILTLNTTKVNFMLIESGKINVSALLLVMIGLAIPNFLCPIQLLDDHQPHQLMRKDQR